MDTTTTTPDDQRVFLAEIDLGKWTAVAVARTPDEAVAAAVARAAGFLPADPATIVDEWGVRLEMLTLGHGFIV